MRKPAPGLKFAVGDKLRLVRKGEPTYYSLYKIGDIVTVRSAEKIFTTEGYIPIYSFKKDVDLSDGWGEVEKYFELIE